MLVCLFVVEVVLLVRAIWRLRSFACWVFFLLVVGLVVCCCFGGWFRFYG